MTTRLTIFKSLKRSTNVRWQPLDFYRCDPYKVSLVVLDVYFWKENVVKWARGDGVGLLWTGRRVITPKSMVDSKWTYEWLLIREQTIHIDIKGTSYKRKIRLKRNFYFFECFVYPFSDTTTLLQGFLKAFLYLETKTMTTKSWWIC